VVFEKEFYFNFFNYSGINSIKRKIIILRVQRIKYLVNLTESDKKILTSLFRVKNRYAVAPIITINISFNSFKDFFIIRLLLFFLFFLGFLAFLIDVSVGVSGADFRDISNIGQSLFKICIIGSDDCFNSFSSE
jgi:hypothetical protein